MMSSALGKVSGLSSRHFEPHAKREPSPQSLLVCLHRHGLGGLTHSYSSLTIPIVGSLLAPTRTSTTPDLRDEQFCFTTHNRCCCRFRTCQHPHCPSIFRPPSLRSRPYLPA